MDSTVHVVILNWNNWQETLDCVRSLQAMGDAAPRITVLENGSADESAQQLQAHLADVEIRVSPKNLGFAAGNNVVLRDILREGTAEFVWLLNNDTVVDPVTLPALVAAARRDGRIGAVGAVVKEAAPPHGVQIWGGGWVCTWLGVPWLCRKAGGRWNYLCGCSLFLRRKALEDVGLLDEGFFFYFEDADLCFRLRRRGWRLVVAETAHVYHKAGVSVGQKSALSAHHYRVSLIRFMRKYAPWACVGMALATVARLVLATAGREAEVVRGTLSGWQEGWRR